MTLHEASRHQVFEHIRMCETMLINQLTIPEQCLLKETCYKKRHSRKREARSGIAVINYFHGVG
jgi:hypothetical protein